MEIASQKIAPCLWYDSEAEDAAKFYVSVFKNSRLVSTSYYGEEGFEIHGRKAGTVMSVEFELEGLRFVGLNGGPIFKFDEAISFQIYCDTQDEVDYFWTRLTQGGSEGPCGWLKDKFGLSWQVVPRVLLKMLMDKDSRKSQAVMKAFMQMKKFHIAALKRAFEGETV
jgi:predicted 3-demethylubiquinone-9 3-methyltransferase (glyoxalase superfamily)